jgi:dihydroorotase
LGGTITTHHLVINRNHILVGGIKPHYYCLPVAKREDPPPRAARAATSGDARFFLGTDSAPHVDPLKEHRLRLRGLLHRHQHALVLAEVFEQGGRARPAGGFTSLNGPAFYGLP